MSNKLFAIVDHARIIGRCFLFSKMGDFSIFMVGHAIRYSINKEWMIVSWYIVSNHAIGRVVVIISSLLSRLSISFSICCSWTSVESGKGCICYKLST